VVSTPLPDTGDGRFVAEGLVGGGHCQLEVVGAAEQPGE